MLACKIFMSLILCLFLSFVLLRTFALQWTGFNSILGENEFSMGIARRIRDITCRDRDWDTRFACEKRKSVSYDPIDTFRAVVSYPARTMVSTGGSTNLLRRNIGFISFRSIKARRERGV